MGRILTRGGVMEWTCEKCGHVVGTEPKGRVCGQDRYVAPTPEQKAMGLDVIPVPCAGEFRPRDASSPGD